MSINQFIINLDEDISNMDEITSKVFDKLVSDVVMINHFTSYVKSCNDQIKAIYNIVGGPNGKAFRRFYSEDYIDIREDLISLLKELYSLDISRRKSEKHIYKYLDKLYWKSVKAFRTKLNVVVKNDYKNRYAGLKEFANITDLELDYDLDEIEDDYSISSLFRDDDYINDALEALRNDEDPPEPKNYKVSNQSISINEDNEAIETVNNDIQDIKNQLAETVKLVNALLVNNVKDLSKDKENDDNSSTEEKNVYFIFFAVP